MKPSASGKLLFSFIFPQPQIFTNTKDNHIRRITNSDCAEKHGMNFCERMITADKSGYARLVSGDVELDSPDRGVPRCTVCLSNFSNKSAYLLTSGSDCVLASSSSIITWKDYSTKFKDAS